MVHRADKSPTIFRRTLFPVNDRGLRITCRWWIISPPTRMRRARRLIAVAHPDFRDQLTFDAKKAGYII